MGKYINVNSKGEALPALGKADALKDDGAIELFGSKITYKKHATVCVVENGAFDAAGYCYSEDEFNYFKQDLSGRPARWFHYSHAEELAQ